MEALAIIFDILFWAFVGIVIARIIFNRQLIQLEKELAAEQKVLDEQVSNTIVCVSERHGDQIYLFNRVTDEFIAQGHTIDEIKARLQERYKGTKNIILVNQKDTDENSVLQ